MSSRSFTQTTDDWMSLFGRASRSNGNGLFSPGCSMNPATEVVRGHSPKALQPLIPEVGQSFAGFQLVRELGRGAFGRVFLAEQKELAGRPVALKVVPGGGAEVRTLARLQHTNIVPVYSVHVIAPLTALCMPYFGETTLSSVLSDVKTDDLPTSGRTIAESIRRRQLPDIHSSQSPAIAAPIEEGTYVDAVLWIGERLADALAHAHERGVVHRDIKPANILLSDDGQPMLLDFNLADDGNESAFHRARMGGTLPYMPPEQMRAFAGDSVPVDHRADIYALGAVLFHLLARRLPYPERSGDAPAALIRLEADRTESIPDVRTYNPDVTPAVESILRTCLQPDAAERYPTAAALRDDLARQRTNLPLRFAPEPSLGERMQKWVRRHPSIFSGPARLAYFAAIFLITAAISVTLSLDARTKRQDEARAEAIREYEEFFELSDRAKLAAGSPAGSTEVHRLGTDALKRYGWDEPGWDKREKVTRLPAAERERLVSEIGELSFLTERAAAVIRRDVGQEMVSLSGPPTNGREGFLRACDLASRGRHREALRLIVQFVSTHPEDFGGWFLKARCHDLMGQFEDARSAYATCAALRPLSPRPVAARGELAFRHGRDLDQALADLDRALRLDPNLAEARLTRALVHKALRKHAEALADLDQLIQDKRTPTRIYFVRAGIREASGDREGAAKDRAEGVKREPLDAASFVTRGLALAAKDSKAALADFQAAEKLDPFYPDAMVNQAWILGEKMNRLEDALAAVDRLLAIYPEHQNGRGGRAVLLARLGRSKEAIAEARACLEAAPHPGAYYHAACVYAVVSVKDGKQRDEGVKLVAKALLKGFGHEYLLTDADLDPLRNDEKFKKLVEGVKVMKELSEQK